MAYLNNKDKDGNTPSRRLTNKFLRKIKLEEQGPSTPEDSLGYYNDGIHTLSQEGKVDKKAIENQANSKFIPKEAGWMVETKSGAKVTDADFSDGGVNKQDMKRVLRVDRNQKWKNLWSKMTGSNKGQIEAF